MKRIDVNKVFAPYVWIGTAIFVFSLFLSSCANGRMTHIPGGELADQIASGSPLTIVDVRSSDEYKSGHIPGAIHIPYWSVFTRHSSIPSGEDTPVIIYCEHGPRAKLAKLFLRIVGFQQVVYLEGHLSSWKKASLPLETPASP